MSDEDRDDKARAAFNAAGGAESRRYQWLMQVVNSWAITPRPQYIADLFATVRHYQALAVPEYRYAMASMIYWLSIQHPDEVNALRHTYAAEVATAERLMPPEDDDQFTQPHAIDWLVMHHTLTGDKQPLLRLLKLAGSRHASVGETAFQVVAVLTAQQYPAMIEVNKEHLHQANLAKRALQAESAALATKLHENPETRLNAVLVAWNAAGKHWDVATLDGKPNPAIITEWAGSAVKVRQATAAEIAGSVQAERDSRTV